MGGDRKVFVMGEGTFWAVSVERNRKSWRMEGELVASIDTTPQKLRFRSTLDCKPSKLKFNTRHS